MSRPRGISGPHLDIPRRSTEIQDPGAHELSSEDEFEDAPDGRKRTSRPVTPTSPIPITRVERVDDTPAHGEVPGTPAYGKRQQDAVPDEIEIVPEGRLSKRNSRQFLDTPQTPQTPGGTPIPRTVVEQVDSDTPSYGDEPGTSAYKKRLADAVPDILLKTSDPSRGSRYHGVTSHSRSLSAASIPETIVTRADDEPAHGDVPGTEAARLRKRDATPDRVEIDRDVSAETANLDDKSMKNDINDHDNDVNNLYEPMSDELDTGADADGFGDDFDDFEEGAHSAADDDFGDFDDFDQQTQDHPLDDYSDPRKSEVPLPSMTFPLLDFETLSNLSALLEATKLHLDAMFPTTSIPSEPTLNSDSIPLDSPIFPTDRSRSLWKQLITPPPLQPPNWTQSRIRRLFLISLGVPVDLDEILPPSKQKKLILPDISLTPRTSMSNDDDTHSSAAKAENDNISKLKTSKANDSAASIDSQQSATGTNVKSRGRDRPKSMKPGQHASAPSLDLSAVKRTCATTEEKLQGFTDEELQTHVHELESLTEKTSQLLEYWLKRRDGLRKEKEAFEGVIENLVRHAKRVRTIK